MGAGELGAFVLEVRRESLQGEGFLTGVGPQGDAVGDGRLLQGEQRGLELPSGRGLNGAKVQEGLGGGIEAIDPIEGEDVKMDVEVHRAAEALDEGDGAGAGAMVVEMGGSDQVGGETAVHDAQDLAQGTRVGGAE